MVAWTRVLRISGVLAVVATAALWAVRDAVRFRPPDAGTLEAALGPLEGEPSAVRRLLLSAADAEPLGAPRRGDWLAEHSEAGQTFPAYAAERPRQARPGVRPVVLGWAGAAEPLWSPEVAAAAEYLALQFQAPVRMTEPVSLEGIPARERDSGLRQVHAGAVLERLRLRLPEGAACLLSFTAADLYPQDSWNFVFGLASIDGRVGVHSMARLWDESKPLRLRRLLQVAGHEAAHSWGLRHCVHRRCLMNGFNSLVELDRGALALCPICLRKLSWGAGVDVERLHRELAGFLELHGLSRDAAVLRARSSGE